MQGLSTWQCYFWSIMKNNNIKNIKNNTVNLIGKDHNFIYDLQI